MYYQLLPPAVVKRTRMFGGRLQACCGICFLQLTSLVFMMNQRVWTSRIPALAEMNCLSGHIVRAVASGVDMAIVSPVSILSAPLGIVRCVDVPLLARAPRPKSRSVPTSGRWQIRDAISGFGGVRRR